MIPILNPLLNNYPYSCKNGFDFKKSIEEVQLEDDEEMISYDAEALFPSLPIATIINHIHELLISDVTLASRTKLTPRDIKETSPSLFKFVRLYLQWMPSYC